MTVEALDPADWRQVAGAGGLLRAFNEAGVIDAADVHVAQRLTAMAGESNPVVALAVALAVRALRGGSVCVDLGQNRRALRGRRPRRANDPG